MGQQTDAAPPYEVLVGLLLAQVDGPVALPARPWPLADACRVLAARLPSATLAAQTARRVVAQPCADLLLERWALELAQRTAFRPSGRGPTASWQVSETWRREWQVLVELLDEGEREVWGDAAQALQRSLSTAAKIASAASRGALASMSST